jgi:hypothetical protein
MQSLTHQEPSAIPSSQSFDEYELTNDELEDVKKMFDVMVHNMKIIHQNAVQFCHILIKAIQS